METIGENNNTPWLMKGDMFWLLNEDFHIKRVIFKEELLDKDNNPKYVFETFDSDELIYTNEPILFTSLKFAKEHISAYKIGKIFWTKHTIIGIAEVVIEYVLMDENENIYYWTKSLDTNTNYPLNHSQLFKTKEQLLKSIEKEQKEKEIKLNEYRQKIKTKHDLVTFMINESLSGDDMNEEALIIVKEKAKELLDVIL